MDIEVGDRVTYKSLKEPDYQKREKVVINEAEIIKILECVKDGQVEILKIERPKYEVTKEKKELLTEEEKEFLKQYIKMSNIKIKYIQKETDLTGTSIMIRLNNGYGTTNCTYYKCNYFKKLIEHKDYTLKELELNLEEE